MLHRIVQGVTQMTNNKASKRRRTPKGVLGRLIRTVFQFYPVLLPVTLICILINAIVSSIPSIFMQNVIAVVDDTFQSGDWGAASGKIISFLVILISLYIISLLAGVLYPAYGNYYTGHPCKDA